MNDPTSLDVGTIAAIVVLVLIFALQWLGAATRNRRNNSTDPNGNELEDE